MRKNVNWQTRVRVAKQAVRRIQRETQVHKTQDKCGACAPQCATKMCARTLSPRYCMAAPDSQEAWDTFTNRQEAPKVHLGTKDASWQVPSITAQDVVKTLSRLPLGWVSRERICSHLMDQFKCPGALGMSLAGMAIEVAIQQGLVDSGTTGEMLQLKVPPVPPTPEEVVKALYGLSDRGHWVGLDAVCARLQVLTHCSRHQADLVVQQALQRGLIEQQTETPAMLRVHATAQAPLDQLMEWVADKDFCVFTSPPFGWFARANRHHTVHGATRVDAIYKCATDKGYLGPRPVLDPPDPEVQAWLDTNAPEWGVQPSGLGWEAFAHKTKCYGTHPEDARLLLAMDLGFDTVEKLGPRPVKKSPEPPDADIVRWLDMNAESYEMKTTMAGGGVKVWLCVLPNGRKGWGPTPAEARLDLARALGYHTP